MNFTIETAKWSWPATVQSPNIYRDEEFIRTKTKEEALDAIDFLMQRPHGLTYTITVCRDGSYFTYFRHTMPCLGGLVKYRDSHGERYSMNPYFPRDIRVAFPEGDIIFIACYRANTGAIFEYPFYEFMFSQESPWVTAFGTRESLIFKNNYFVLTNMDTDPTVFYSLMRLGPFLHHGYGGYKGTLTKNINPKAELLLAKRNCVDPRRLAGQKPWRISGGTWKEGYGYTRPYNESIFKTSLPHKYSQFSGLASYPQALQTADYFQSEMQKMFGIDVSQPVNLEDKKIEEVFVQAWDYFKEKSKELSDDPN